MKTFDPTKPVQTKCGKPADIIAVDLKCDTYPIAARFIEQGGDRELVASFTKDGQCCIHSPSGNDLVNIPEKVKVKFWVNVNQSGTVHTYKTRDAADNNVSSRIACICIEREVTEGGGL